MLTAPDVAIVAEAKTKDDALRSLRVKAPDVIVMGAFPVPMDKCIEVVKAIKIHLPSVAVIMITSSNEESAATKALQAGCSGFLVPSVTQGELLKALREVVSHERVVSKEHLKRVLRAVAVETSTSIMKSQKGLTPREYSALRLIVDGQSNCEIASNLGCSLATAKDYVRRITQKLHVSDRTQAAVKAIRAGLIS